MVSDQEDGKLGVEYIAHASFLLHYQDKTILLDPFANKKWIGYSFPKGVKADAIFSTHPHYDHDGGLFLDSIPYWKGEMPLYQDPGKYQIGPFAITGIKGKHSEPYGKEFGQKNTIWVIKAGDIRVVHWGDNGPINKKQIADIGRVDILMVPIDSTYHILEKEQLEATMTALNPKIIIPMHYKHPDLESEPDKPKNLGPIIPALENKKNVTYLDSNTFWFGDLASQKGHTIMVFKHSPNIKR